METKGIKEEVFTVERERYKGRERQSETCLGLAEEREGRWSFGVKER